MTIILASVGRITTHFRQDIGRGFLHRGIDQGHGNGAEAELEIRAPASGVVVAVGWLGTYGLRVAIRHDDGRATVLAHHSRQYVTKGQRVAQGQLIARMGNTSTKYVHSHQELMDAHGTQLDPLLHLGSELASVKKTIIEQPEIEDEMKPIILTDSNNIGIIINWAEGTWRGIYGSETAAHIANGANVQAAASDADYEDIKRQLRPWRR